MTRAPAALRFADVTLEPLERLAYRAGCPLALSPLEYRLLEAFLSHPRQALSRQKLAELVWGHSLDGSSNFVDVAVTALRKKLETGGRPRLIKTVRGYGYALRQ